MRVPTLFRLPEFDEPPTLLANLVRASRSWSLTFDLLSPCPSHTMINYIFKLFFFPLALRLPHFLPTRKSATTQFPYCLLVSPALPQILGLSLPTALSHRACSALAHVVSEPILCFSAHDAHFRDGYDHRPLPCRRGKPKYHPPSCICLRHVSPSLDTAASRTSVGKDELPFGLLFARKETSAEPRDKQTRT